MKQLLARLGAVVVVALPIVASLLVSEALSEHDQKTRATTLARVVLDRAARTTDQLAAAFTQMRGFGFADPCSDAALAEMRRIDLGSSLLQGIGFATGNTLECSSIDGRATTDLGPVDYISATGAMIRQRQGLEFARGTPLLIVTGEAGFTGFVHPSLIFEMTDGGDAMPSGLVGYSTRALLLASRPNGIDWAKVTMPAGQMDGTFVRDGQLVAWVRSARWDQFSFATIPWSTVADSYWSWCAYLFPLGLAVGLFGLWLMRRLEEARSSLPALLRMGLRRNEILLVYQPIVDMRTGAWVGAEVLARWRRRSGEWVSPDIFIPIAEKHGLITQLTRFVIAEALTQMGGFLLRNPPFFLSINVSSSDLGDEQFPDHLRSACGDKGIAPPMIHLEITERQEVDQVAEASVIARLRAAGFKVGTDDFGVGYSNLAYLENFELDYLKIDRVFVANAFRADSDTQMMIAHIIEVGKARHMQMIAEGIERPEQRDALLARGVSLGQGWLFARAMPAVDFARCYAAAAAAVRPVRDELRQPAQLAVL